MKIRALLCIASMLPTGLAAPAYAASFTPASSTINGWGLSELNGTACYATVAGTTSLWGDSVSVRFTHSGAAPCTDIVVDAVVEANGDVKDVKVYFLPVSSTVPVCDGTGITHFSAITLNNFGINVDAETYPFAITVAGCSFWTSVTMGPMQVVP
ncbi:hypothetical protein [Sphingopyxis granuli]|uniref:hypothetical protein n=1 Tax=Sphingopyxis granuli TaxID=267128 RepID=UPI001BB00C75|nr:hypothetical protein [Sphingopyxis granuli]QUM71694.1 hypothetical protein ICN83_15385 [Sphingopyxis granuli]